MPQPYPLSQMLPTGVFVHRTERIQRYINYPVFSWPWYWRRACFFGPFGFFFGATMAAPLWLISEDWILGLGAALRFAPAWCFIMVFGTALGTWVRYQAFAPLWEKRMLILAVLVGIGASYAAKYWYEDYLDEVAPLVRSLGGINVIPSLTKQRGFKIFYEVLLGWIIISSSGGRALFWYFKEIRRWQTHGAKLEILAVKQQRDDADRKLSVLQAQVEPHFLYNTLASVRSLVRSDPPRAEATIDALVDHLRNTLPKLRDQDANARATLGDQIEICRSYLDVMCIRMGARLRYSVDVPAELESMAFPPLMLLSLVENAIKHGVEPKPGSCSIALAARLVAKDNVRVLEVSVSDDGAGLFEGPSGGLGLANIRAQLAARYAEKAMLKLQSRAQGGVVAYLTIPVDAGNS